MKKPFLQVVIAFTCIVFSLSSCGSKQDDELSKLPINALQNNGIVSIDFQKTGGVGTTWVKGIGCSPTGIGDIFPKDGYQTVTLGITNDPDNPTVNFQEDVIKEYIQKNVFLLYNKDNILGQTLQLTDKKNIRVQPIEVYVQKGYFDTIILDVVFEVPDDINVFALNIVRQDRVDQFLGGCK
jgi:hypothetical protein